MKQIYNYFFPAEANSAENNLTEDNLKDQCKSYLKKGLNLLEDLLKSDLIIKENKTPIAVLETLRHQIVNILQSLEQNKLTVSQQKKILDSIISHFAAIRHCLSLTIGKGKELFSKEEIYSPLSTFIKDGRAILERYLKILPSVPKKQKEVKANDARPSLLNDNLELEEKRNREQIFLHNHAPFQLLLTKIWRYTTRKKRISKKIFISYAWPKDGEEEKWTKEFVERLAAHLIWAGFQVFLDELQSGQGYPLAPFMEKIQYMDHVLVISTRSMGKKLLNQGGVWYECEQIRDILKNQDKSFEERFVIPVLLNNKNYSHGDFQKLAEVGICFEGYLPSLRKLISRLYKLGKFNFDEKFNASWEKLEQSVNTFVHNIPLPPTKSISDNNNQTLQLVTHFKQALKEEYLKQQTIPSVFGKDLTISEAYVNLSLIDEKKNKDSTKKEEEKNSYRDGRISSFEDLFGEKRNILLTDLFKPDEKTNLKPTRILVQGRAGIGKSFFIKFINDKCLKGELWANEYPWVFKIVLRRLTQDEYYQKLKQVQIKHIVFNECFSNQDWKKFQIFWEEHVQTLPAEKKLFLLDGFDEIASIINNQKHPVHNALLSILKGNFPYILTSRPYGLSNLPSERRNVEIIGFTNENIEKYVQKFMENSIEDAAAAKEKANKLLASMRTQVSLWSSAHIPLLLNFICGIYEKREVTKEAITLTSLYQQIEMEMLERALKDNFPEEHEEIFAGPADSYLQELHAKYQQLEQFLGWVALEALQQETLLISPKLIDEGLKAVIIKSKDSLSYAELRKQNYQVGFLRPVYEAHTQCKPDKEQFYEFLHLTFQEYYAAKKIAHGLQQPTSNPQHQEAICFIRENKWDPRYQIVFRFIAGLLKDNEKTFGIYLNLLQEKETCDLIGQYQLRLLIPVLEEGYSRTTAGQLESIYRRIQQIILSLYHFFLSKFSWHYCSVYKVEGWHTPDFFQRIIKLLRFCPGLLQARDHKGLLALLPMPTKQSEQLNLIDFLCYFQLVTPFTFTYLTTSLMDKDSKICMEAVEITNELGRVLATPEMLMTLSTLLKHENENIRLKAANAIETLRIAATPKFVMSLRILLQDKNPEIRSVGAKVISYLREAAAIPEIIIALKALLSDEHIKVRTSAASAIVSLKPTATSEIITALTELLKETDNHARWSAAYAIAHLKTSETTAEIFTILAALTSDEYPHIRETVASWMGEKLCATTTILPRLKVLTNLLKDQDPRVRTSSIQAIEKFDPLVVPLETITVLRPLLNDPKTSFCAFLALNTLKVAAAPELITALDTLIKNRQKDDYFSYNIDTLLESISGALREKIISHISNLLNSEDIHICSSAIEILRILGEHGLAKIPSEIVTILAKLLSNGGVCQSVVRTIKYIGPAAATPEIITKLGSLLKRSKNSDLEYVIRAIQSLGPAAAKPKIIKRLYLLLDNNQVGVCAAEAIKVLAPNVLNSNLIKILEALLMDDSLRSCKFAIKVLTSLEPDLAIKPGIITALSRLLIYDIPKKMYTNVINILIGMAEQKFEMMFLCWQTLYSEKTYKQGLSFLTILVIASYLASYAQQVVWNEQQASYYFKIFEKKSVFSIAITHQQAQCLRHLVPTIVSYWEKQINNILDKHLPPIIELLRKVEQLPALTEDPLLPEIMIKLAITKSPNPLTMPYNVEQSVFSKITSSSIADNNNTSDPPTQEEYSP